jgi:hypothetical protein
MAREFYIIYNLITGHERLVSCVCNKVKRRGARLAKHFSPAVDAHRKLVPFSLWVRSVVSAARLSSQVNNCRSALAIQTREGHRKMPAVEDIGRRRCIPIIYTTGTHYEVGFDVVKIILIILFASFSK